MKNENQNINQNINQNKELSLQEQLAAQDEFAFLDEEPILESTKEDEQDVLSVNNEIQEEVQSDQVDDSFDLFEASKQIEEQEDEEEIDNIQELQEEIAQTAEINNDVLDENFVDFSENEIDNQLLEKPEVEPQTYVAFENEIIETPKETTQDLITVRPVKFQEFENTPPNRTIKKNLDLIQDVPMHISVELGRTKSSIRQVMALEKASIVELDKIAGEQVEIFVNQKLVAKGEVIVIEDKFGVRVTSTTNPKQQ